MGLIAYNSDETRKLKKTKKMTELEFLEENNKALHITGVNSSILSPLDWIKKVQGIYHLEYLNEDGVTLNWTIQLMEWYGDYVGRKVKEYLKTER